MAAAVAKEHQGHEAAPDQEREEGAETKCNPAVLAHLDAAGVVPMRRMLRLLPSCILDAPNGASLDALRRFTSDSG